MKLCVLSLLAALNSVAAFHAAKITRFASPNPSTVALAPLRISTGDDMSEQASLDISKTVYSQTIKSPKDSYLAFAEKGASNAKMSKMKIFHQSVMGGAYVGFGGLLSFCIAGNIGGIAAQNPGIAKMAFASLFPVNLLLILTTGGQLFTGNSATVSAAKYEGLVTWRELWRSWGVSIAGNVVGCTLFAIAAWYVGLLTGGTADLVASTAMNKCRSTFGQTLLKAVLCNWMVSLAVFLAGACNDLTGKLVGIWFPISTFVAIGLEHSVANMFIMPAALLLNVPLSLSDVLFKNVIPVVIGNAIAGAFVVAGSYSYQFGKLGRKSLAKFEKWLEAHEATIAARKAIIEAQDATNKAIRAMAVNGSAGSKDVSRLF